MARAWISCLGALPSAIPAQRLHALHGCVPLRGRGWPSDEDALLPMTGCVGGGRSGKTAGTGLIAQPVQPAHLLHCAINYFNPPVATAGRPCAPAGSRRRPAWCCSLHCVSVSLRTARIAACDPPPLMHVKGLPAPCNTLHQCALTEERYHGVASGDSKRLDTALLVLHSLV